MGKVSQPEGEDELGAWAVPACQALVARKQDIEDHLNKGKRLDAFRVEMGRWRDEYLEAGAFQVTKAADALRQVCYDFGILSLLQLPEQSGAQRVRGVTKPADPADEMRRAAKAFTGDG